MGTKEIEESLKGINSSLEIFTNLSKQMEERFSVTTKEADTLNDHLDDINKKGKTTNNILEKWNTNFSKINETVGTIGASLGLIGLATAFKSSLKIEQDMKNLAGRMGLTVEKSKELTKSMKNIGVATGYASDDIQEMMTGLIQFRVVGEDVEEAAKQMLHFSKVTGLSNNESIQLYGTLNKVGGMDKKAIKKLTTEMAMTQRIVGFTDQEMSILSDSIQQSTFRMSAFGKTQTEISAMAKGTMSLAGAFVKVGLSAGAATELIDKLNDPTQIQDNVGLYSQLGISIEDAMSDNINPEEMTSKLKGFAEQVSGMGKIAGSQYAAAFGMNYKDLMKMTELDTGKIEGTELAPGTDSAKQMEEMAKKQEGMQLKLEKIINRINAVVVGLGPLFLGLAVIITAIIIPKITKGFRKATVETSENMKNGLVESMGMGAKKGFDIIKEKANRAFRGVKEDYQKNMVEGSSFSVSHMKADLLSIESTATKAFGFSTSLLKGAENYTRSLANSNTLTQGIGAVSKSIRNYTKETLNIDLTNNRIKQESLSQQKASLDTRIKENNIQIANLAKAENLTKEEEFGKRSLVTEGKKMANALKKIKDDEFKEEKIRLAGLRKLSAQSLTEMIVGLDKQQLASNDLLITARKRTDALKYEADLAKAAVGISTKDLDAKKNIAKEIATAINSGDSLNVKEISAKRNKLKLLQKEISEQEELNSIAVTAEKLANEATADQNAIVNKIAEEVKLREGLVTIRGNKTKSDVGLDPTYQKPTTGFLNNITGLGKELWAGFKVGGASLGKTIAGTFVNVVKSGWTVIAETIMHPLKSAGNLLFGKKGADTKDSEGNTVKGKRSGGLIGKVAPMLGIGLLIKILQPFILKIKEKLVPIMEELMDKLGPALTAIADALIPIILTLVKILLPKILIVLSWLLPPLLRFLGWITKTDTGWKKVGEELSKSATTISNMDTSLKSNTKATDNLTNVSKPEATIYNSSQNGTGFNLGVTGSTPIQEIDSPKQKTETADAVSTTATNTSALANLGGATNDLLTLLNGTMKEMVKAFKDSANETIIASSKANFNNTAPSFSMGGGSKN